MEAGQNDTRRLWIAIALVLLGYSTLFLLLDRFYTPEYSQAAKKPVRELEIYLADLSVPLPNPEPAKIRPVPLKQVPVPAPEISEPSQAVLEPLLESAVEPVAQSAVDSDLATLAPVPEAQALPLVSTSAFGADTAPVPAIDYLQRLDTAIQKNLQYPAQARKRGVEGSVLVEIRVDDRGLLRYCEIARSSGSRILDAAALKLLRGLFPFALDLGPAFETRISIVYTLESPAAR
ncbi:energy transducer TonB [Treponema sp.]